MMLSKSSNRWGNQWVKTLVLGLSCFTVLLTHAQSQLQLQALRGMTLPIHPDYPEILRPARGLGWTWYPSVRPDAVWRRHHPKARLGYSLWGLDPGNSAVLGQALAAMPVLRFTFWQRKNWRAHALYGSGIAFINQTFHPIQNPTNIAMGARLNSVTLLQIGMACQLPSGLGLQLDMIGQHYSNSNVRIPNLGLNVVGASLGVQYGAPPISTITIPRDSLRKGAWRMAGKIGRGFTGSKTPGGPTYPVWVGSAYVTRTRKQRLRWRAGFEAFHTESVLAFAQNQDIRTVNLRRDGWGLIAFGGAEFLFGHAALVAQLGPYLRRPFQMDFLLYTKWGGQFYLHNQHIHQGPSPYLGVYVHAHSGEADFAEVALGWVF